MLSVDHASINLELSECVINFCSRKLLSPGHQGVSEHFSINLSVDLKGFKRSDNDIVVVGTSRHLLCEESDHLGEVDGSWSFTNKIVSLGISDGTTNVDEGGLQVIGSDDAVLVNVDDAESLLELLD